MNLVITVVVVLTLGPAACCLQSRSSENASVLTVDWTNQKRPVLQSFMRPSPVDYMKALDENRTVLRARILLDNATTVDFSESPKDINFYDSTVEVKREGKPSRSYNVGNLIKHQALSLVHIAFVPFSDGSSMLVCEYEGGSVGAKEGFAILRLSAADFELHTLPLTDYGKVVVFRSNPKQAVIWSASDQNVGAAAAARAYITRTCHLLTKGYECSPPKEKSGVFIPSDISDPGIEIRP